MNVDNPVAGAARLVEDGVFVYGSIDQIAEKLRQYEAAGVDEVVLNTSGVMIVDGSAAALHDAAAVLAAVT